MIIAHDTLYSLILTAYLVASVLFLANLALKHPRLGAIAMSLSLVGVLSQTAALILRGVQGGMTPFSTPAEGWAFLAWTVVSIYLSVCLRPRLRSLGAFILPVALGCVLVAVATSPNKKPILPGAQDWALILHVFVSILGVGAFVMAFVCAVCYLLQDHLLKEKRLGGMVRVLPPLDVLDTTSYWLVVFGFVLLTLGVATGAILAHDAWGGVWLLRPKAYVTILLWLTYATYLYIRGIADWRGRRIHLVIVIVVLLLALVYGGAVLV